MIKKEKKKYLKLYIFINFLILINQIILTFLLFFFKKKIIYKYMNNNKLFSNIFFFIFILLIIYLLINYFLINKKNKRIIINNIIYKFEKIIGYEMMLKYPDTINNIENGFIKFNKEKIYYLFIINSINLIYSFFWALFFNIIKI